MERQWHIAIFLVVLAMVVLVQVQGKGLYSWMQYDHFDEVDAHFSSVNGENCVSKSKAELVMRKDVVSQLPVYNQLLSRIWYRNRTSLIHIHNMALNRAFYYSYVLQKMNDSATFSKQPNWMYFYFSAVADVNANPTYLNGSAFYFDNDCHYPNWYTTVPFNKTLPLFGPKAYRWDDYRDQDNLLREVTMNVVQVVDAGSGRSSNYTHPGYKMNPWYPTWMPDVKGDRDSLTKFTYYIGMRKSNATGQFTTNTFENYAFFGPPSPSASDKDPSMLPVHFTPPYFDCGGYNKWVVSAVSPVIDYMPRYSNYTHLRRQRVVGVSVMDTEFFKLDYNACGVSPGNPGPSYLSGISRCRGPSTGCKHKIGYGFRRGNYICHCKGGWRYPWYLNPPFQGEDVEEATEDEYKKGFVCTKSDYRQVLPIIDNLSGVTIEGGITSVNSGGLELGIAPVTRRKRHALNDTTQHRVYLLNAKDVVNFKIATPPPEEEDEHQGEEYDRVVEEKIGNHTLQEIMELADKLRELRESGELKRVLKAAKLSTIYDFGTQQEEEDYITKNSVDVDIERRYERDVKEHKMYKKYLADTGVTKNFTVAAQYLRDNLVQLRDRHIERFYASKHGSPVKSRRKRAAIYDQQSFDRMMQLMRKKGSVNPSNCHDLPNHRLRLPGDVGYGVNNQFAPEGRTALRLSQFLSMYLQNVMPTENFGDVRGGGLIHEDQMFGEVLANVMGNYKIYSSGVYFDRYKFENSDGSNRELFGPWSFRKKGAYYVIDTAGYSKSYLNEDWFIKAKSRYAANFFGIKQYKLRAYVRSDHNGTSSIRHEYFPVRYRAAPYETGYWTAPHFRCDGNVDAWVVTYVSPFFGLDSLRTKLEFRGVTTVDIPLNLLEINQCPQPFSVANAFKNTARCDYFSTTCVPQAGFPFMRGSYRCLCRLGFDYWHADGKFWIEGSLMELEYEKKKAGIFSRFDDLNCRVSSAPSLHVPSVVLAMFVLTSLLSQRQNWL